MHMTDQIGWLCIGLAGAFLALTGWAWRELEAAEYQRLAERRRRELRGWKAFLDASTGSQRERLNELARRPLLTEADIVERTKR